MLEEAEENKIVKKESNFDNLVDTTFKLGLSDKEKRQKQALNLPHFEKIDRGEGEGEGGADGACEVQAWGQR